MKPKSYHYVGSSDFLTSSGNLPQRCHVVSQQDILDWITTTQQIINDKNSIIATFVIDVDGLLWIADRHSEHVQCARGGEVLSAGEITFTINTNGVDVLAVTNQSTGYCPEPESWTVVQTALDQAALNHPSHFTIAFTFRRCVKCGNKHSGRKLVPLWSL
jgi:hypothetical protein